jgi:choline dehydrogenase
MSRPNLDVRINTAVHELLFDHGHCTGVRVESLGEVGEIRCEREVILSAGTYNSPQLLQLSGIGSPADLEPHGIKVRHALPGVGANLQDHQSLSVDYVASGEFCFDRQLRLDRLALSVLQWKMFRNGILARSPISAQGLVRTAAHLDRPDLQMLVAPVSIFARPWFPGWRKGWGHTVSNACVLLHPQSRGKVSLRSADPRDKPDPAQPCCRPRPTVTACATSSNSYAASFATAPAAGLVTGGRSGSAQQAMRNRCLVRAIRTASHHPQYLRHGPGDMSVVRWSVTSSRVVGFYASPMRR